MASLFKRREPQRHPGRSRWSRGAAAQGIAGHGAADAARIEGHVDLVDGERVTGWALDAGAPGRRLLIEVSAGDAMEVVLADIDRDDLQSAGKGDGRHGFEARLDIGSTGADAVHVRVVATGQHLIGSPVSTDLGNLVAKANNGRNIELLRSEAQLALLSLKGARRR